MQNIFIHLLTFITVVIIQLSLFYSAHFHHISIGAERDVRRLFAGC